MTQVTARAAILPAGANSPGAVQDASGAFRYGSVCSGIEAASVAWEPLGWRPAFFSEIDPFPRAVLAHRFPEVPCHGDFTTIGGGDYGAIDLLVGGTPCQSFSVAGLRGGLGDDRGNLALEYLRLADRKRPRWLVWENVPGVLSSNGGRDFGAILGGMVELGYGFAYRVLNAQYVRVDGLERAVPQRRRRVFVVGYLGDWRRAAAVLFERESLSGHPAPRREAGESVARPIAAGSQRGSGYRNDADTAENLILSHDPACTLTAREYKGALPEADLPTVVAHALRGEGFDASEDGTGRGTPIIPHPYTLAIRGRDDGSYLEYRQDGTANAILTPNGGRAGMGVGAIAFDTTQITSAGNYSNPKPGDPCHPLAAGAHPPAVALGVDLYNASLCDGVSPTIGAAAGTAGNRQPAVMTAYAVRRLTPRECERLQGFPDDWTVVPYRGKSAADGPRYKALGNSMAVNCMRWIGRRIDLVERIAEAADAA
jgi:DNA (cytosine-5)-methyltransferase 1